MIINDDRGPGVSDEVLSVLLRTLKKPIRFAGETTDKETVS